MAFTHCSTCSHGLLLSLLVLLRGVEAQPLLHTLPHSPSTTPLPELHCGDDCGSLLITNLVDLNHEVHVLVPVGERVYAVVEYVPLVVKRAEASLQIL